MLIQNEKCLYKFEENIDTQNIRKTGDLILFFKVNTFYFLVKLYFKTAINVCHK